MREGYFFPDNDMTQTHHKAIQHTQQWLTESVIVHQFCPYAKQPHEQGSIGYQVYTGENVVELLELLMLCCIALDQTPAHKLETSLLIIANEQHFLADFYDYLDVLDAANQLLEKPQYVLQRCSDTFIHKHSDSVPTSWHDTYQIASFHPAYVFADAGQQDKENYTNRSPYPIFHILRNASIDKVRMDDEKAARIVSRNCSHLQQMNAADFQKLVALAERQS